MDKVTRETLFERLQDQEFKDFLSSKPHPVKEMDDSGYTFLDYILYKKQKFNRPLLKSVQEINNLIDGIEIMQWHLPKMRTTQIN